MEKIHSVAEFVLGLPSDNYFGTEGVLSARYSVALVKHNYTCDNSSPLCQQLELGTYATDVILEQSMIPIKVFAMDAHMMKVC